MAGARVPAAAAEPPRTPDPRPGQRRVRFSALPALALLLGALCPFAAAPLSAAVLVSNLAQDSRTAAFGGPVSTQTHTIGQGFTTGSSVAGYSLSSIEARVGTAPTETQLPAIRAELWSAAEGGGPGAMLETLTVPSSVTAGTVSFAAPAGTRLEPDTTYYFVAYTTGDTTRFYSMDLDVTIEAGEDPGGQSGWAIENTHWKAFDVPPSAPSPLAFEQHTDPDPVKIRVNGAAEPTAAVLSALAGSTSTDGTNFRGTLDLGTFSAGVEPYFAQVATAVTHVKLTPTVHTSGATVKAGVRGTTLASVTSGSASAAIPLEYGETVIDVEVTATDTVTTKTYSVTVTRLGPSLVSNRAETSSASPFQTDFTANRRLISTNLASAFTTGDAAGGYTLTDILVSTTSNPTETERQTIRAELWSATPEDQATGLRPAGSPLEKLADLTVPSSVSAGEVVFIAPAETTLEAETTYYFVWYTTGTFNLALDATESTDETAVDDTGWSIADDRWGDVEGRTPKRWTRTIGASLKMSVNGFATPATPTTVALVSNIGQDTRVVVGFSNTSTAGAFVTGSQATGYDLASIEIDVSVSNSEGQLTPAQVSNVKAELWSSRVAGMLNVPKSKIVDLQVPSTVATGVIALTPIADTDLDANARYHVVLRQTSTVPLSWDATGSDDEDDGAAAGWLIEDYYLTTFSRPPTASSSWFSQNDSFKIRVNGSAAQAVTPAPTTLTLTTDAASDTAAEDAGTVTVTATLDQPAGAGGVEVTLAAGGTSTATSADYMLPAAFTISAGDTSATADVTIVDDDIDEDNETLVLTTTVAGLTVTDATLTITDNDTAGVTVSGNALSVAPGATATYTVVLDSKPTADVTVTPTSGTPANATVSAAVTFMPSEWDTPKTITVTGVKAGSSTITHAASSSDGKYPSGLSIGSVEATVAAAAVTLVSNLGQAAGSIGWSTTSVVSGQGFTTGSAAGGYVLSGIEAVLGAGADSDQRKTIKAQLWSAAEGGGPGSKEVDLEVPLTVAAGTLSFAAPPNTVLSRDSTYYFLLYTTGDHNLALSSTESEDEDDGSQAGWSIENVSYYQNRNEPSGSWQSAESIFELKRIRVSGSAAPVVAPTTLTLTTDAASDTAAEDAGTVTVTATLNQPAGSGGVAVTLAAGGASTATSADYMLPAAFTIAQGDTSATANVTIVDDDVDEDNETLVLTTAVAGLTVTGATLTITDNDTAGVTVSRNTLSVAAGSTATYTLVLDSKPTANVTVTPTSGTPANATVSAAVTFMPSEWDTPKTITVTGVKAGSSTITHAATSSDGKYPSGLSIGSVAVTVTAAAPTTLTLTTDAASNTAAEDAGTVTVTATLNQPAGTGGVSVTLAAGGASTATSADYMLPAAFTIAQGDTSATGNVTIVDDDIDEDNETLVLTTTVAGLTVTGVTLTITDNDTAGATLSGNALSVAAGATATYTVVLDTKPAAAVTVTPTSGTTGNATVSAAVTFMPSEWDTPKTITVTGVKAGSSTITHAATSTDPKYPSGLSIGSVAVTVTTASAGTLVSNLGQPRNPRPATTNGFVNAQGFTTGSNAGGYTISSIATVIKVGTSALERRLQIRAELWSAADGGGPGAKIVDLEVPLTVVQGTEFFNAPENTWLPPNTTFFFVPYTTGGYDMGLFYATSTVEDSSSQVGWSILDQAHFSTGNLPGTSWTEAPTANVLTIRVNGAAAAQGVVAAAPPGLGVTPGAAKLDLSWTPPSGVVTGYDVHYTSSTSVDNDADAGTAVATEWVASTGVTGTAHTITGLMNDTPYRVRVRATNSAGSGAWAWGRGTPKATTTGSTDATLDALVLKDGSETTIPFTDSFVSTKHSYTAYVGTAVSSVKVTPTVNEENASVEVNGTAVSSGSASDAIAVGYGANMIAVEVTAQAGNTQNYTITLNRALPLVAWTGASASTNEGSTYTPNLSAEVANDMSGTVTYAAGDTHPASPDDDLGSARTTTFTMAAGDSSPSGIDIPITDDDVNEEHETFTVTIEPGTGYSVGRPYRITVTIYDNDQPAPPSLTVAAGDGGLTASWQKPAGPIGAYQLRWKETAAPDRLATGDGTDPSTGWVRGGLGSASSLSQRITELTNGTPYDVQVRADDGQTGPGTGFGAWSATQSATPNPPPSDLPRNVRVTAGDAQLTLTWQAPSSWATRTGRDYRIEWKLSSGGSSDWSAATGGGTLQPGVTSYEFSGTQTDANGASHTVANGTSYDLRIRASSLKPGTDGSDPSHIESSAWVTVSRLPSVPSQHAVLVSNLGQPRGAGTVHTINNVNAQGFTTGSNAGGYTISSIATLIGRQLTSDQWETVRAELWSAAEGGGPGSKIVDLTVPLLAEVGTVSFAAPLNTWLPANTTYFFIPYTTIEEDLSLAWVRSTDEDSESQAGWSILDRFHSQMENSPGTSWSQANTGQVLAIRVNGAAVTKGVVPDAPSGLGVTPGAAKLDLSWTAPAGLVTGYDVHYTESTSVAAGATVGTNPATEWADASHTGTTASHTITGLKNDTPYRFRVRGVNFAGDGAWAWGTGTPKATTSGSTDATLDFLQLSLPATIRPIWFTEPFSRTKYAYRASVGSTVASVTVTPTVNEENATVKVNGTSVASTKASGPINLDFGASTITVVVTAQAGNTQTYTIAVNRALPAVSWAAASASTNEGSATYTPSLNAEVANAMSGTVAYAAGATHPASLSDDIGSARTTTFTMAADDSSPSSINVPIADDGVNEEDETFTVTIEAGTGYRIGSRATQTVTIIDDDPPAVPSLSVARGDGELTASWTKPAGPIGGYDLRWKETAATDQTATTTGDPSTGWVAKTISSSSLSQEIADLTNDTSYDVQVRATDGQTATGNGYGAWSAKQSATPAVPEVSGVALTSNPGTDSTYAIGDAVQATATFTTAVDVDITNGRPQLELDFEGTAKTASYASGTGTAALVFSYTVAEGDADADGIAIEADKLALNGGTIQVKDGYSNATLTHVAVSEQAGHKVDGVRPTLSSAEANGTALTLTYSEALNTGSVPAAGDFAVKVEGSAATLANTNPVAVSGSAVTLTLSSALIAGQTVTVSYTAGTNPIRDAPGNGAANLTDEAVTNKTPPVVSSVALTSSAGTDSTYKIGDTVSATATFSVAVDVDATGGTPQLELDFEGTAKTAEYASGTGTDKLVFSYTVAAGDTDTDGIGIKADKLALNGGTIKIKDGDTDATLAHQAVAENSSHKVDGVRPTLSSAEANGAALTLTYSESLDAGSLPAAGAFGVKVAGNARALATSNPVAVSGSAVTLTLSSALIAGQAVTVSYTAGSNPLRDAAGNDAANLTDRAVTNKTPPTVSSVTLTSSAGTDSTYAIGDTISATATFSTAVDVVTTSGRPQLELDFEGTAKQAAYASGTGTAALVFSYTVQAGDTDTDGIGIKADKLALNGGTIKVANGDTDATLAHQAVAESSSHKVDGVRPTLSSAEANGTTLTLTYSETLDTASVPAAAAFTVKVAGNARALATSNAVTVSGSAVTLTLSSAVTAGQTVTVSYTAGTGPIQDAAGNDAANLTDRAVTNATKPAVSSVALTSTPAMAGTYAIGATVSATATFSTAVDVDTTDGTPQLELNIGGTAKQAAFASGSGSAALVFSYTVLAGDADSDGISIEMDKLALNGGTIKIADGDTDATLAHAAVTAQTGHKVDGVRPTLSGASGRGTTLTLTYSETLDTGSVPDGGDFAVKVADTARDLATSNPVAVSGSAVTLTLSSAVTAGQSVTVSYTKGTNPIQDAAGNDAGNLTDQTVTNTEAPTVSSVALTSSAGSDSTYAIGDTVSATATFSTAVDVDATGGTPQLELDFEGTAKTADYASGTGTAALVFSYTVQEGDADADGIGISANKLALNGGTIKIADGDTDATLTHLAAAESGSHKVDGVRPTLSSAAASGTALTLTYSETLKTGSVPAGTDFEVKVAGNARALANTSPVTLSGTAVTLTLSSAVTAGQAVTVSYTKGDNPLQDAAGNDAGNLTDRAVTNTTAPTVSSVALTSSPAMAGTYAIGATVSATATFSTAVDVDTTDGTPQLELNVGGTAKQAAYASGSGNAALVFSYTVAEGDEDSDGISITADKLALNGGTIKIANGDTDATLAHAEVTAQAGHKVDGARPTLSSATANGTALTLTYSESLDTGSVPAGGDFEVKVAGTARDLATSNPVAVSGSALTLTLSSAVTAGQEVTVSYTKGDNPIQDAAGNDAASLTDRAVTNNTPPVVSRVALTSTPAMASTYAIGATVSATATFSTAVDVDTTDGTPQLELDFEGTAKTADYASGTGTTALVFSYTVQAGDADADGIGIKADKLALNGGTIKIKDGDTAATLAHAAVTESASHKVDGVRPTLSSAAARGSTLTLTYSESLDTGSVPGGSDFAVTVAGNARDLATSNAVSVSGSAVTLTLSSAVTAGQSMTVSYTKGTNPIQDAAGNDAENLSSQAVTNTVAPTVSSVVLTSNAGSDSTYAITDTVRATATFSTPVDVDTTSGRPQLELNVGGTAKQAAYASGTGTTALVFSYTVAEGDADTDGISIGMDKLALNGGTIKIANGDTDAELGHAAVTTQAGHKVDGVRPTLSSAEASGTALTLTYSESLDADSVPDGSDFAVTVASSAATLATSNPVAVSGSAVTLTLASAVTAGQSMTVSYTKGSNAIQDAVGNDAADLTNRAVTVTDTTGPSVHTFAPANGATVTDAARNITLTFNEPIKKDSSNTDFSGHSDLAAILTLKQTDSAGSDITYAASINAARTIITINPANDLPEGDVYVAISDVYYDSSGNQGQAASATFTVEASSSDATLSALTGTASTDGTTFSDRLDIGTFAATTTIYTATVANAVTHVKLTPTVKASGATVAVGRHGTTLAAVTSAQASQAIALGVGSNNVITVRVTAPDSTTQDYTVTVTRQAESTLAARFSSVPATHNGSAAFSVRIEFTEPVTITDEAAFRDHSVEAPGGTVTDAERVRGDLWEVTVQPDGGGAVVVALLATASCADPGALCAADGRRLPARVVATVRGPDTAVVTIAPVATAITEGEPAAFRLRRTAGATPALTVGLSVTGAGGFIAGSPPQAVEFLAGETTANLDIPTEDDALSEPGVLLTVELSEDAASPPDYVLGSARRAVLQVHDNDGGEDPPTLPGTPVAPIVQLKPLPLRLALWTDKPGYIAGETVRLFHTLDPHDDRGQYRVFAWLERAEGGDRRYLAPLAADGALHPEPVDIRGLPEHASRALSLPRADKALAWDGESLAPGRWRFVLELRPGAAHEQYEEPEEPLRTRRAWASFTIAERGRLLNRRGFDREFRADATLRSDALYYIGHQLFVRDGVTLTIEAGTVVQAWGPNAAIIVEPGGRLVAEGTREAPVVLTCSQPVGQRGPGCWGGVRILGKAPVTRLEGVAPGVLPAERGLYGGTDADGSGGLLRYVRVEFAGAGGDPDDPDAAAPAIGLYGAGGDTVLDHVQVRDSLGDGFAFRGGTARCDHCVASGSGAAGLSWERGWRGGATHLYVQHGRRGLDGLVGGNDEQGHDLEPRSLPTLSNVSLVHGWPYGGRERKAVALRLFTGSGVTARDLLATRFPAAAIDARGRSAQLFHEGESSVRGALFYLTGNPQLRGGIRDTVELIGLLDPKLRDVRDFANPDPRPKADSPALPDEGDGYIGAFGKEENWLEEWTVFGPESLYDPQEEREDER